MMLLLCWEISLPRVTSASETPWPSALIVCWLMSIIEDQSSISSILATNFMLCWFSLLLLLLYCVLSSSSSLVISRVLGTLDVKVLISCCSWKNMIWLNNTNPNVVCGGWKDDEEQDRVQYQKSKLNNGIQKCNKNRGIRQHPTPIRGAGPFRH